MTDEQQQSRDAGATRRRYVLIGLALIGVIAGAAGSWIYNDGYKTRAANNSAVIRSAADPSTYVKPGDYTQLTVPIRNDSPYAITVVNLVVPSAPRIRWSGKATVVQPGATENFTVTAPSDCAAMPHTLKSSTPVTVILSAVTANGKLHNSLRAGVSGVLQYAADYCYVAPKTDAKA
jgi:hypothetical protein